VSDERITVTRAEITVVETTSVARPVGVIDHWCEHPGCTRWGSFGFRHAAGDVWYCGEDHPDPVFAAKVKSRKRQWNEG